MSLGNLAEQSLTADQVVSSSSKTPLLIGDTIHVLNSKVHSALVTKNTEALADLARQQLSAGAKALAVNLGPGKEMGQLTEWVGETLLEVAEVPLFFSANIMSHREMLQARGSQITINAVTANHDELVCALEAALQYGSSLVVLLVQSGKMTAGLDDKLQLASEVLDKALSIGLPISRLYLDPVLSCRPDPVAWNVSRGLPDVGTAVDTISLIKQLDGRVKTIVGLGNGSEGMASEAKSGFQRQMYSLLVEAGLDAVLLNCLDREILNISAQPC